MKHCMKLTPAPFEKIKSGRKNIELRLYDEKRRKISVGDDIEFTQTVSGEKIIKTVVALHIYASFDDLFRSLPPEKCGFDAGSSPDCMREYYPQEEEQKYGVVGIELNELPC